MLICKYLGGSFYLSAGNATYLYGIRHNLIRFDKTLRNEKYIGDVVLGKTNVVDGVQVKSHDISKQFIMRRYHPAIIPHELFHIVQEQKRKRSKSRKINR